MVPCPFPPDKIPPEYPAFRGRELKSDRTRAYALSSYPGIPYEYSQALKAAGIRSSMEFFEYAQEEGEREKLSLRTGIPSARLREILSLCDLSRIKGVGPVYARIIYLSGFRTLKAFAGCDPLTLQPMLKKTINRIRLNVRPLSPDEVRSQVNFARNVMKYNLP